jgi:hypothetical protein
MRVQMRRAAIIVLWPESSAPSYMQDRVEVMQ